MNKQYLQEAFKSLSLLDEEVFDLDDSGIDDMKDFVDTDKEVDFTEIIDPEAETEEELQDSYLGKVVLDCCTCHSKIYKNKEDLVDIKEEDGKIFANEDEECPYCAATSGYEVIGEIKPFTQVTVDVEPKDEPEEEVEVEETEEVVEESVCPKCGKAPCECKDEECNDLPKDNPVDESLEEDAGQDVTEYQKWVDYDMEKYHRISDDTMEKIHKAGLSVVKDQYGDYEVIADRKDESLKEDLENIDIETEHDKIHVEAEEKPEGEETIAPLDAETKEEIITQEEEQEEPEEEVEEQPEDEVDYEIDDFDEETFDTMGESYLKNVYENVSSFKTTSVANIGNGLLVEGIITFNSGKEKKTSFKFEAKDSDNTGNVRFLGENLQITKGKKAFTLKGSINEGKFTPNSFRYNYTVNGNRIYGTIKNEALNEAELSKVAGTAGNAMANAMDKLNACKTVADVANLAKEVIPEDKKNEPKVKQLIHNLETSRNLERAQTAFTNFILKGDKLGVI